MKKVFPLLKRRISFSALFFAAFHMIGVVAAERSNVLFICVDDLNHWVGYTGRNPQCKTPNIDRLSAMGVSFTNSHCAAPACGPSRASLFSGMRPSTTGCYHNDDPWMRHIEEGKSLNAHFHNNGYYIAAMGKTYHSSANGLKTKKVYESEWDDYPPMRAEGGGGAKKYEGYFEPLPLDMKDEDLADWRTVDYCAEQMNKEHDKPFFLMCGFIKPHLPWAVPQKYYDMYPLDEIQLPPHKEGDLDDVPEAGVRIAKPDGDHAKFQKLDRWKNAVQSYLATIAYVDMNLGRLLDAYEKSPQRDNTIIVFWGDHGWHLGEKEHWRKFALWEEATRTPFIWVVPGVTSPGTICDRPVDYMSIYPTMCELAGLDIPSHVEGKSIVPLLKDPDSKWDGVAMTTHGYRNHAVRDERWRYIRYADGSEELYDHDKDQYEFDNLASNPEYKAVKERLAAYMPEKEKPPFKKDKGKAKD